MPNHGTAIALGLLGATMLTAPSGAQDAGANDVEARALTIETVTVTARRKSENLERVPVAITAISPDSIRSMEVHNALDLQQLAPSLTVSANLSSRDDVVYTIRGQSQPFGGSDPGVQSYFNEMPFGSGGPGYYYDMDNIQILRGPQGTLFGRNTTGGAVLFQPKKPTDQFGGYLDGRYGDYAMYEVQGAVNVPVLEDKLMVRMAANVAHRNGFTKDVTFGIDRDNISYEAFRAGATFKPFAGFENYLALNWVNNHNNGTGAQLSALAPEPVLEAQFTPQFLPIMEAQLVPIIEAQLVPIIEAQITAQLIGLGMDPMTAAAMAAAQAPGLAAAQAPGLAHAQAPAATSTAIQAIYAGMLQPALDGQLALGTRKMTSSIPLFYRRHSWSITDVAVYEFTDHLRIRNIFGYLSDKSARGFDYDGSYLPLLAIPGGRAWEQNSRQITEEFQIQGEQTNFNWIIGFYHEHVYRGGYSEVERQLFGGRDADPMSPFFMVASDEFDSLSNGGTSDAIYASLTYDLSEAVQGLSLTAGGRYTWDHKVNTSLVCITSPMLPPCPSPLVGTPTRSEANFEAPTWTLAANYQINEDSMLYATFRRGYKSGGFNGGATETEFVMFKPEYLTDIELGTKHNWEIMGVPGRTNFDLYYGWYQDVQKNDLVAFQDPMHPENNRVLALTVNAAKATIKGLEFESTFIPDENFQVTAMYSYADASYDEFVLPQAIVAGVGPVGMLNHKGDPFAYTPKHKIGVSGRIHLPVSSNYGMPYFSVNWYWQSKVWFTDLADLEPHAFQADYGTVNLRLDWNGVLGSSFDASAFVNNATDRTYKVGANALEHLIGTTASIYGAPRMVGVELRYRFGQDASP